MERHTYKTDRQLQVTLINISSVNLSGEEELLKVENLKSKLDPSLKLNGAGFKTRRLWRFKMKFTSTFYVTMKGVFLLINTLIYKYINGETDRQAQVTLINISSLNLLGEDELLKVESLNSKLDPSLKLNGARFKTHRLWRFEMKLPSTFYVATKGVFLLLNPLIYKYINGKTDRQAQVTLINISSIGMIFH